MKNFLKFWGTRGSCAVSGQEYKHFGGNTSCLEISYGSTRFIIDAGTGIRPLGHHLMQRHLDKIDIFLSHTHWDHLIGFPFFEPLYYSDAQITIWAPKTGGRSCRELFEELLSQEFFPVRLSEVQKKLDFRTIDPEMEISLGEVTLSFHEANHPGITLCFKLTTPHQTIGYITDNEASPELSKFRQGFVDFFSGCDLLIHEAQYSVGEYEVREGWGHSCLPNVVALVEQIRPHKWLVTHHDPQHTDSDLQTLSRQAEELLQQRKMNFSVEWIPDGHIVELK